MTRNWSNICKSVLWSFLPSRFLTDADGIACTPQMNCDSLIRSNPLTHAGTVRWLIVGHTQLRFRGHSLMRDCWRHARWRDSAMHARRATNGVSIINTVTLRCIGVGSLYFSHDENTRCESHREGYLRSPQKLLPILQSSHDLSNCLKDSSCFL